MSKDQPLTIRFDCVSDSSDKFASLLQRGFLIPCAQATTISDLLFSLPGFTRQYLEQKVQTIFINGSAADRVDLPLRPGDTLALSAAMPGLAGAIFRRGGQHGSLRSQPAHKAMPTTGGTGYITVKLFNTIAVDRAGELLAQGILLAGRSLHQFLVRQQDGLLPYTRQITMNNAPCTLKQLHIELTSNPEGLVRLSSPRQQ